MLLAHPRFYSVVAEAKGRIVGSNFLDERSRIAGVGPITVDPTGQNRGVGGRLMQDVLDRAARQTGRRRAPAAGRLPQSLALPLHQAWFSHPRARVDPPGQAARADISRL